MIQKKQKEKEDTDAEDEESPTTSRSRKETKKKFRERKKVSEGADKSVSIMDAEGKSLQRTSRKDTQVQQSKEWDQSRKDILTYLDALIGSVEWFVKLFHFTFSRISY